MFLGISPLYKWCHGFFALTLGVQSGKNVDAPNARLRHSVVNVTKSNTGMWRLDYLQKSCTRANVIFYNVKNEQNR